MATGAQRNQVLYRIVAEATAGLQVMYLQVV